MSDEQSVSSMTRLDPGAIQAIVNAAHGDPFAVLGPHEVKAGEWEIRAILPNAGRVVAVGLDDEREIVELTRVHPAGFYAAPIAADVRPGYRLRISYGSDIATIRDPYSFGSSLDEHDVEAAVHHGSSAFYHVLGAQEITHGGVRGLRFAVWAPNASCVSVVGGFNDWDGRRHPMRLRRSTGVWELFVPGLGTGVPYKYEIKGVGGQPVPLKADPAAFAAEHPPATASLAVGLQTHKWRDADWIAQRSEGDQRRKPMSIYECHLGSWARVPEEGNRYLTYGELAERLIPYVKTLGFTHIELLPITEYPFDGSWGYQPVSLFAPTSRFGTPDEFAEFVEAIHAAGLGVILDWVPAHFPNDAHGLGNFDSTHLYEHADPRQGFHQDWGTYIYNFGRSEVSGFLVANARYWLEHYHLDGLRVDAVASMLYLDYSREAGAWVPNRFGGNENLEAIDFLRRMNETAYQASPGIVTIAEESTSWPGVSKPTYLGGLGFGFKWNMGWMHDTLRYMESQTVHRRYHHHEMTFGLLYAFSENFILPISHDEVVHGKGSLINKMQGDEWQKFANLRAYFGFMWSHPGKKLLFMGCEFAQMREWNHDASLDWHLTDQPLHRGVQSLVRDLNAAYKALPALHELDCEAAGFDWIIGDDSENSVFAFLRRGTSDDKLALVVCNFTPVPREGYRIGVPRTGFYREIINTDAGHYGGSNMGNMGGLPAEKRGSHGHPCSLTLTLPPLATLVFALE